jgi:hypothetical protein
VQFRSHHTTLFTLIELVTLLAFMLIAELFLPVREAGARGGNSGAEPVVSAGEAA